MANCARHQGARAGRRARAWRFRRGIARPRAGRRGAADHPRRRNGRIAARLHSADPEGRRTTKPEDRGRHHQRPAVQRLRRRWPPHLRQSRRPHRLEDAEPDHRRTRARNRPHRRRSSCAAARATRQHADHGDPRDARGRRGDGRGRARQQQHRPGGARHVARAAEHDSAHATFLCAHAGGVGGSRRREVPRSDGPVAARHGRDVPALRQRLDVHSGSGRSLPAKPSDAARAHPESRTSRATEPLLQQEGSARAAASPRHDACQAVWLQRSGRHDDAALSFVRHFAARALRARDRNLSLRRSAERANAGRCAFASAAEQSLSLRAVGPGAARSRQAARCDPGAAQGGRSFQGLAAHSHSARPSAGADQRQIAERRSDPRTAHRHRARADRLARLSPACDRLRAQGRPAQCRARFRTGCLQQRRHSDRAAACAARAESLPDRLARLDQV